ncbi:MAG: hypothetical protein MR002_06665 [Acholeplasmatales bacterium]|nr:hypothetical protein [Acholeplasmatales bacterium]
MKRKTLTLTLSILACLALIGVGFASWIISAEVSATPAEGSFIVDTVTDRSYNVEGAWLSNQSNITFGAPTTMNNVENAWLTNNSEDKKENLTVTYQLTVKYGDNTPATGIKDKIITTVSAPADTNYTAAVDGGLIIAPTNATVVEAPEGNGKYNITVTYQWGEHFGNVNPYTYYNAKTATDKLSGTETTYMQDAKKSLDTLSKIEETVKFTLNITVLK